MCSPARCNRCGKTTWAGCGDHAAQVMAAVAPADRCDCPTPEPSSGLFGLFRRSRGR